MMLRAAAVATGWLLLIVFSGSGLVKHSGEFESQEECQNHWSAVQEWLRCLAAEESGKDDCFVMCGQPIGYCVQGIRLNAPGATFPLPKERKGKATKC